MSKPSTSTTGPNYQERVRHAEIHLDEFVFLAEAGRNDLVIGQQAQNALEHGMKALIHAAGGEYPNTHSISDLLGAVRHFDPTMNDFSLAIPPDVYTEYEGPSRVPGKTPTRTDAIPRLPGKDHGGRVSNHQPRPRHCATERPTVDTGTRIRV